MVRSPGASEVFLRRQTYRDRDSRETIRNTSRQRYSQDITEEARKIYGTGGETGYIAAGDTATLLARNEMRRVGRERPLIDLGKSGRMCEIHSDLLVALGPLPGTGGTCIMAARDSAQDLNWVDQMSRPLIASSL